jgi:hypothetical protein
MANDKNSQKEKPLKTAEIIFFPRHRIVRTILRGNKVYSVEPLYPEWDEERRAYAPASDAPKSA